MGNFKSDKDGSSTPLLLPRTTSSTTTQSKQPRSLFQRNNLCKAVSVMMVFAGALSFPFLRDFTIDAGLLRGNIPSINMETCRPVPDLQACEDIHIHHASGLAFSGCGSAEGRKVWFPPLGIYGYDSTEPNVYTDNLVIYDMEADKYKFATLQGFPSNADRNFHGIGIYDRSPTEITLFMINHRRTGSVVEVFDYTIGDDHMVHAETIQHELIVTPNDIVAMGPREFYISNDHKHAKGIGRLMEEYLRMQSSNVIYYSPKLTTVAFEGVSAANGITGNPARTEIYLSGCHGAMLYILSPQADHTLAKIDSLKLDFFNDNIFYDIPTRSLFIAGHVQPLQMVAGMQVKGVPVKSSSKVIKISRQFGTGKLVEETVLQDNGDRLTTSTTAALDRKRNVMMVGTAVSNVGMLRCEIPKGF